MCMLACFHGYPDAKQLFQKRQSSSLGSSPTDNRSKKTPKLVLDLVIADIPINKHVHIANFLFARP